MKGQAAWRRGLFDCERGSGGQMGVVEKGKAA